MSRARAAVLLIALALGSCESASGPAPAGPSAGAPSAPAPASAPRLAGPRWKAILLAGDGSIPAFDNAVQALERLLERRGVQVVATFSGDRGRLSPTVELATHDNLLRLPARTSVSAGEGCLFYATSHGTLHGLRLPQDPRADILSPAALKQVLTQACGAAPTVLVVSACHSGTFIRQGTVGPNIIILTAARDIRRSFGCRAERRYTYYDGCLLTELPQARTWQDLHARMLACIQGKEAARRELPSEPQAFFGASVKDLPIPGAR